MKALYWDFIDKCYLYREIRHFYLYVLKIDWYYQVIAFLIFLFVLFYVCKKNKSINKIKSVSTAILPAYIFILFSSLVFSRAANENYMYNFVPFWTIPTILEGNVGHVREMLLNCLMLVPVGFLFPYVTKRGFKETLGIGLLISISLELLQLIFKKGLCELDDVIYNVTGALIGLVLYRLISKIRRTKNDRKHKMEK